MKKVFAAIVIICIGLFVGALINIDKTVNTPVLATPIPAQYADMKPVEVAFASADGNKLSGWYFKAEEPKGVVIVVHGLSESTGGKSSMIAHAKYLNDAGYSAFLIDLRGFGESKFSKISFGTQEWKDVEAAFYEVKKYPENKNLKVGFLGHSMGGAAVIIAAGRAQIGDFVIADVPFASPEKFLKKQSQTRGLAIMYPFVAAAARYELGAEYSNITAEKYIGEVKTPVLIIGGIHDSAVDPQDAEDLYKAATTQNKTLWMSPYTHNTYEDGPRDFEYKVLTFLNTVK